jgi:ribosome biogenesis SPOUT family RNA methylase Rps3
MAHHVGAENLIFTRLHPNVVDQFKVNNVSFLKEALPTEKDVTELEIPKEKVCLLDMEADRDLCPEDVHEFDAMLFGGILGMVSRFKTYFFFPVATQ